MRSAPIWIVAIVLTVGLGACSPQAALLASLVPDGTVSTLLGHLERVEDENRKRVVQLERTGRWSELASFAELNLAKDGSNAEWWIIAGYAQSQAGDHQAAANAYMQAVRLEPDSALAWNMLAQSHRAAGNSAQAITVLNRALLSVRDAPLMVFLLGESYSDLGRYGEAVTAYRQSIALENEFSAAWYGLARAYARMGRGEEAEAARARLAVFDPERARLLSEAGSSSERR